MFGMPSYFWWGAGVAIVATVLLRWWLDRRRASGMADAADNLGLREAPDFDGRELRALPLFRLADAGEVRSALRGRFGGRDAIVFDYRYRIGTLVTAMTADSIVADAVIGVRKNREPTYYNTTGVAVALPANAVPAFELREEAFTDRIRGNDVDLPEDPAFSRRFYLQGADPARLRERLTPRLRSYLLRQPAHWCIESDGDWLMLYPWAKTIPTTSCARRSAAPAGSPARSKPPAPSADPRGTDGGEPEGAG